MGTDLSEYWLLSSSHSSCAADVEGRRPPRRGKSAATPIIISREEIAFCERPRSRLGRLLDSRRIAHAESFGAALVKPPSEAEVGLPD